jgi:pseudaminic acid biosynthesis-associated methylase
VSRETKQMDVWASDFGKNYTDRNPGSAEEMDALYLQNFGVARTALNQEFLGGLDRSLRILEAGCNVGTQLSCLQRMGFTNLYGVELQWYAVEESKRRTRQVNLVQGSIFDIPFKDGFFDLVFTSGVLIHIAPGDLAQAQSEVLRCSRRYVWGYEYFAETHQMIPYRGQADVMWKGDFAAGYAALRPGLKTVSKRRLPYLEGGKEDEMFLLELA